MKKEIQVTETTTTHYSIDYDNDTPLSKPTQQTILAIATELLNKYPTNPFVKYLHETDRAKELLLYFADTKSVNTFIDQLDYIYDDFLYSVWEDEEEAPPKSKSKKR